MNARERKTAGFKPILVSPETHARLAEITKKCQSVQLRNFRTLESEQCKRESEER